MAVFFALAVSLQGYVSYVLAYDDFCGASASRTPSLRLRLDQFISSRSIILAEPMAESRYDEISVIVASMIADADIESVKIYDAKGRVIDSYGEADPDSVIYSKKSTITFADEAAVRKVGYLEILAGNENLLQHIWRVIYFEAAMGGVFILLAISITMIGYRRAVGIPLEYLRRAFIRAEPEQDRTIDGWHANDEFGELIQAYNNMQTKLQAEESALRHIRLELETRVRDRTKELDSARQSAVDANKAKSEFLSTMSHELRTPLNAILAFSEVLHLGTFGPVGDHRYREYALDIHNSGRQLLDLINDVLDISRIETGKYELDLSAVDICEVIESAIETIREHAKKKTLELGSSFPEERVFVRADNRALRQARTFDRKIASRSAWWNDNDRQRS